MKPNRPLGYNYNYKMKPMIHRRRKSTSQRHRKIFNKIIAENISNLEKEMVIQMQEGGFRTPNGQEQKRTYPCHITVKNLGI
jgi:hypothetical protein